MTEIVDTIQLVMAKDFGLRVERKSIHFPSAISDIARLVDAAIQAVGLYNSKIHVLSELNLTIACDISKACRELGYVPLVELNEGHRRGLAWCIEERGLVL